MPEDKPSLAGSLLLAQETERKRIAKELHSGAGQQIAALSLIASNLKRRISPLSDEAKEHFYLLHLKLSGLANTLQRLSHRLYPAVLEHSGLSAALEAYCRGIEVEFAAEGKFDGLTPDEALCLYRVAEGALHSISAPKSVKLSAAEDIVELHVAGPMDDLESLELAIIRERARLVGGEAQIRNGLDGGIRFTLRRGA